MRERGAKRHSAKAWLQGRGISRHINDWVRKKRHPGGLSSGGAWIYFWLLQAVNGWKKWVKNGKVAPHRAHGIFFFFL